MAGHAAHASGGEDNREHPIAELQDVELPGHADVLVGGNRSAQPSQRFGTFRIDPDGRLIPKLHHLDAVMQGPREPFERPDQSIVEGIALGSPGDGVAQTLPKEIQTRSFAVDGLDSIRLNEALRRDLGERWCLEDESGEPLVQPHHLEGGSAFQPGGGLPLGGAAPLDMEPNDLLTPVDDDIQQVAQ